MLLPTDAVNASINEALAAVSVARVCDSLTIVAWFASINEASSSRDVAVLSRKSLTSAVIEV